MKYIFSFRNYKVKLIKTSNKMDGENNGQESVQQQNEGQQDPAAQTSAQQLAADEAYLEAQAASLAEVKRRRKE